MRKRDLTEGKSWFEIVAKSNNYLWLFIGVLVCVIWGIVKPEDLGYPDGGYWVLLSLGVSMLLVLGYKGLYQKYNDLKKGKIR